MQTTSPKMLVFDNDEFADRYTVVFPEYAMEERGWWDPDYKLSLSGSADPFHPQGIGHVGPAHRDYYKGRGKDRRAGKKIAFEDLPPRMQDFARQVAADPEGYGARKMGDRARAVRVETPNPTHDRSMKRRLLNPDGYYE